VPYSAYVLEGSFFEVGPVDDTEIALLVDLPYFTHWIRYLRDEGKNGKELPVATQENRKIFVGPGEGAHLPILDIVHKITTDRSGGSLTIDE
jgi:hypothetical protein